MANKREVLLEQVIGRKAQGSQSYISCSSEPVKLRLMVEM